MGLGCGLRSRISIRSTDDAITLSLNKLEQVSAIHGKEEVILTDVFAID